MLRGHDWSISGVAISPDGGRAITGSIDGTLKLWDINSGRLLRNWLGHERGAYGVAFTADGRHAVTGSGDYTIKLWDLDTGKEIRRFDGHSGTVYALVISDDGKRILSGSLDGTARLWDFASGNEIVMFDGQAGTGLCGGLRSRRQDPDRRWRPLDQSLAGRRRRSRCAVSGGAGLDEFNFGRMQRPMINAEASSPR